MTLHEVNDACGDCWAESREVTSTMAYRAVSHSALLCLTSLHIPKGHEDHFGDAFGYLLWGLGIGWAPAEGSPGTTWHMVMLGSIPHSEGGKAFQAFGEQAPQQGSENSSHLICGPKTGWGTSENQRQVLQKGGGSTTGAFQPGREGHECGLTFRGRAKGHQGQGWARSLSEL